MNKTREQYSQHVMLSVQCKCHFPLDVILFLFIISWKQWGWGERGRQFQGLRLAFPTTVALTLWVKDQDESSVNC